MQAKTAPAHKSLHRVILSLAICVALLFERNGVAGGESWPDLSSDRELVLSVIRWEGEYESRDVPGGVETTPKRGTVYLVDAAGGPLREVADSGDGAGFALFSGDGRFLYHQAKVEGRTQIFRRPAEGGDWGNLTAGDALGESWRDAYGYSLSADGRKMVYTVHNGSEGRVVLANADGSDPAFVAPHLGYIYMAALSPTADRVVFSGPSAGYRLKLVALPDGEPVDLTPEHPECFVPRFTPDGRTIVFVRRNGDVYSVDAAGGNFRRLTEGNTYVEFRLGLKDRHGSTDGPDISPDGTRIAYIALRDGVPNVCVMNVDGSDERQVTFRTEACGRVRWSPDGRSLAFVSFTGDSVQCFVVDAAGGEPRQLTDVEGAVYFVEWRPPIAAEPTSLSARAVGEVDAPTFIRRDIGTSPGRLHEPSVGPDGNIWTTPLDGTLWRHQPASGETEIIDLERLTDRSWAGLHLWPIAYGDDVYLCTPSLSEMWVWHRGKGTVRRYPFPHVNPAVYGGFAVPARERLYLYDTTHAAVLKWDPSRQSGELFPCPHKLSGTLYMTFADEDREEIWGSTYTGNDLVRFDMRQDKWTAHATCPLEGATPTPGNKIFGTTLYASDHLNGRLLPFDIERLAWGEPIPVPGFGEWFGYISGGFHFRGKLYFCHSTWTGGNRSLDGEPHHFIGTWTIFDPQSANFARLDLPVRDGEDRKYFMADYCAVVADQLHILAVDQREPRRAMMVSSAPSPRE